MENLAYTVEEKPNENTTVLVTLVSEAQFIMNNLAAAEQKVEKLQARYDRRIASGETPRLPRAEIKAIVYINSFNV
jgi:hypothetical protein